MILKAHNHNPTANKISFISLRKKQLWEFVIWKEYIIKPFSVWLFLDTLRGEKKLKCKNSLNQITKRKNWQLTEKHYIYRIYKCDNFFQRQLRFCRENKSPRHHWSWFYSLKIKLHLKSVSVVFMLQTCCRFLRNRKYSGSKDTDRSSQQQLCWYSD